MFGPTDIDSWMRKRWKRAKNSTARYLNIHGHNVMVMPDSNDPSVWVGSLRVLDEKLGPFTDHWATEQSAKRAVLQMLVDKLNRQR